MIASLPMYDRLETAAANDRLWALIQAELPDAPQLLTRGGDLFDHWESPDLILSQTCGLPLRTRLENKAAYVATPASDLDCAPGHYYSVIVTRKGETRAFADLKDAHLAANERVSHSGWGAPWAMAKAAGFAFQKVTFTGAHVHSAKAVAEGQADIAAIDALTWRMISLWDPWARDLQIIERSPAAPAPPFITSSANDPAPLRKTLRTAIERLSKDDQSLLSITGLTTLSIENYKAVVLPPQL